VGAGYSNFFGTGNAEFVYYTADNGGQIRLVVLDETGVPSSDTVLVQNITGVKSVCIGKDGYVYFSVDDPDNTYDGTWRRNTKATNPLEWTAYRDDLNYFVHLSSTIAYDLSPSGNRIYFYSGNAVYYIYGGTVTQFYTASKPIQEIAVDANGVYIIGGESYLYSCGTETCTYYTDFYYDFVYHNGTAATQGYMWSRASKTGSAYSAGADGLLAGSEFIVFTQPATFKFQVEEGGGWNLSTKETISSIGAALKNGAEIGFSPYGVYITSGGQAEIYVFYSEYVPDEEAEEQPSEEPEASPTPTPEPPTETPYEIVLSIEEAYPGQTIRVYVKEEGLIDSYVEGASVYVDGEFVGKAQ